jgi:hypothetical protein
MRTWLERHAWWGLLFFALLLVAFGVTDRRNQRWAWWTMWVLPAWAVGVPILYLVAGVEPDQPPPPPMVSGPILAVLSAAALLVSAPRCVGRDFAASPSDE